MILFSDNNYFLFLDLVRPPLHGSHFVFNVNEKMNPWDRTKQTKKN